ncbi:MAG: S-4TM family putative pore-forming effector [Weeksellaceae bacterium]|nr:S-4TM family putative pore-forming effector [Weeksellaceae bacterium]
MINFDILIDDFLYKLNVEGAENYLKTASVLSLINDFEEGEWRFSKFQSFIWDNIAETALSYRERESLINKRQSTLIEAAKKLRLTDLAKDQSGQGSELAEIVLYGIMKTHYNALPIVPKIFYKQNNQDNAKGSDSVHIVLEGDDDFSLWLGEAKFYNSIEDKRFSSIIDSIENSLSKDKLKKENSIFTNVSDLDEYLGRDSELYSKIMYFLASRTSIDELKPKLHVPIMILYECPITVNFVQMSDDFKKLNTCYLGAAIDDEDLRIIQDRIYNNRILSPLIPDFIYKNMWGKLEDEMNYSVEHKIESLR